MFKVRSPKTEHLDGRESRLVPLFPELLPFVREAFEAADDGALLVCPDLNSRGAGAGLYLTKHIGRAIERAGSKPIKKLFVNCRGTRSTEILNDPRFGPKCESEWIGHSTAVALANYVSVTPDQWIAAAGIPKQEDAIVEK